MSDFVMTLDELLDRSPTEEIAVMFAKQYDRIAGTYDEYQKIMVSVSGGWDSDIVVDAIERIGYKPGTVVYAYFDTGMEYDATKRHLCFLENKYGIQIVRQKAVIPVPLGCKRYGVPFLNKKVSEYISRLQKHGFTWEDKPFDELYAQFPHCKAALRWWCNDWGENSQMNIDRNRYLKEFMVENPPPIPISDDCCEGAKKRTAHLLQKTINPDLDVQGVRKYEGGERATAYSSCFDYVYDGCDKLRLIYWLKNEDKLAYDAAFSVTHSDCYSVYGLSRTGCACCPFGKNWEKELEAAREHEPKLYTAAVNIFGDSYMYTKKYRDYVVARTGKPRQLTFFDILEGV